MKDIFLLPELVWEWLASLLVLPQEGVVLQAAFWFKPRFELDKRLWALAYGNAAQKQRSK
jgi:hypothetical protein